MTTKSSINKTFYLQPIYIRLSSNITIFKQSCNMRIPLISSYKPNGFLLYFKQYIERSGFINYPRNIAVLYVRFDQCNIQCLYVTSLGSDFVNMRMTPRCLLLLLSMRFIWSGQVMFFLIITPRNFVEVIWSSKELLILIFICVSFNFCPLCKTIKWVFVTLRDDLFIFSYFATLSSSSLNSLMKLSKLLREPNKLVSSANKTYLNLEDTAIISLLYIINCRGPNTDPCGIPHVKAEN